MSHIPVLLTSSIDALDLNPDGIYVDGTFGRGGHSRAILAKLSESGRLLCIDKDLTAIAIANELAVSDSRVMVQHGSFATLKDLVSKLDLVGKIDGVLLDLGISSPQVDDATRGFSFMKDGPLDMRMDTTCGMTAAEWVNQTEYAEIAKVLKEYGEERFANRIAANIVNKRQEALITTTLQLANIIANAVPFKEKDKHPATRSFMAIRILINRELADLHIGLFAALEILKTGGKLCVITFHSLEDSIVKNFMRDAAQGFNTFPKDLPILDSAINRLLKVEKKIMPQEDEIFNNRRARSAKLRVATKL